MKKILLIMLVTAFLLSACGSSTTTTSESPTSAPTSAILPTDTPAPTNTPIPTPTVDTRYFTEEFNGNLNNWTSYTSRPKAESDKLDFSVIDNSLAFDLKSKNTSQGILLTYNGQSYDDVRIESRFENKDNDIGMVGLICRYNGENWYGFYIDTNGFYYINYVFWNKAETDARYQSLYNGVAKNIVKGVNEIAAICEGNHLTFIVNGETVREIDETTFNLTNPGKAGVTALTSKGKNFNINFDWVKISPASATSVSIPETNQASESTLIPEQASTSGTASQPYANISAEKAEFWFPFPSKDKGWSIVPVSKDCFCESGIVALNSWWVIFETDQTYSANVSCGDPNNQLYEEIPDSDMLKRCEAKIKLVKYTDGNGSYETRPSEYQNITFSEYNGGMLITLLETSLVKALYEAKPQQIKFSSSLFTDLSDIKNLNSEYWKSDIKVTYK